MEKFRALSLFQPHNLAKAIEQTLDPYSDSPKHLYGSIMALPHTVTARSVAVLGFDYIMIDALHTAVNAEQLIQLIQTVNLGSEGKTTTIVRVPGLYSDLITHALDAGASGIIFPHIDTAEEATQAVSKCRYACSGGERSLSPSALIAGGSDMVPSGTTHERIADAHVAVICQIESPLALENVEAIAATPGLNALMLGPGDLRLSLGLPSKRIGEYDDPKFLKAVERLIEVSEKYHKALMTVAFKVSAKSDTWLKHFSLLMTSADILSVTNGHRTELANIKKLLQEYKENDQSSVLSHSLSDNGCLTSPAELSNGYAMQTGSNGYAATNGCAEVNGLNGHSGIDGIVMTTA